jgi:hypothetical protein
MAHKDIRAFSPLDQQDSLSELTQEQNNQAPLVNADRRLIIWTPTFIVLFALVLTVGLSMTTILIQGWLNGHYLDKAVLLAYMPLLFGLWLAILIKAHSNWVRTGAIFACLWSLFLAGNFWLSMLSVDFQSVSVVQTNTAANSALLAAFLCFSLAYTPFRPWDTWFFRLLPALPLIVLGMSYLHHFKEVDVLLRVESLSIKLLLYLCCAVWLLRPSCWRSQTGPTFLFGLAPLTLLLFVFPNVVGGEQVFFFQQIFLLCILLGAMRLLQGELQRSLLIP